MDYVLQYPLNEDDIDFLNSTSIDFKIFNPNSSLGENDSGWCDAATGARIISKDDRVAFLNVAAEDLTYLTLKYHGRLKPLHNGLKRIYKYPPDIR